MWDRLKSPADRLLAVLDAEEAVLTAGDLGDLATLLERKTQLLDALNRTPPDAETLHELRRRAARTGALLSAARDGTREARDRLAALRSPKETCKTYGRDGQARMIGGTQSGALSRRA